MMTTKLNSFDIESESPDSPEMIELDVDEDKPRMNACVMDLTDDLINKKRPQVIDELQLDDEDEDIKEININNIDYSNILNVKSSNNLLIDQASTTSLNDLLSDHKSPIDVVTTHSKLDEKKLDDCKLDESKLDESKLDDNKLDESNLSDNKLDDSIVLLNPQIEKFNEQTIGQTKTELKSYENNLKSTELINKSNNEINYQVVSKRSIEIQPQNELKVPPIKVKIVNGTISQQIQPSIISPKIKQSVGTTKPTIQLINPSPIKITPYLNENIPKLIIKNPLKSPINAEQSTKISFDRSNGHVDGRLDDRIDDQVDAKVDLKVDKKVEEKVDKKVEEKVDKKVDEKVDKKVDEKKNEKIDEKMDIKIDEKIEETIQKDCLRTGCKNKSVKNEDWDNSYCSIECLIDHCRTCFTNWVNNRETDK